MSSYIFNHLRKRKRRLCSICRHIQASDIQCDLPKYATLVGILRPGYLFLKIVAGSALAPNWKVMWNHVSGCVYIPPAGPLGCVYTLKRWSSYWLLNTKNKDLRWTVLPKLMGQMPALVEETTFWNYREPACVSTLLANNLGYVRSYPDYEIKLKENTLLTLVDFKKLWNSQLYRERDLFQDISKSRNYLSFR